jgi:hypothetical protein
MAIPAQDIRRQIDRHLDEIGELEELSDARYHVTHERFERAERFAAGPWPKGIKPSVQGVNVTLSTWR